MSSDESEIMKVRLKYAWDWWEFHGRQCMNMFNYFLLITGILANGYLTARKETTLHVALLPICMLGIAQCLSFFMIDVRNRTRLTFAEDLLESLEKDFVFPCPRYAAGGPVVQSRETEHEKRLFRHSKMVYWIRGTYVLVAVSFLAALVLG
jgi:hypothetical protein